MRVAELLHVTEPLPLHFLHVACPGSAFHSSSGTISAQAYDLCGLTSLIVTESVVSYMAVGKGGAMPQLTTQWGMYSQSHGASCSAQLLT